MVLSVKQGTKAGLWKYHAKLVQLVLFYSQQEKNLTYLPWDNYGKSEWFTFHLK